jgi:23S rRNA pseudouridine1911/1915/1917 synthase
MMKANESYHLEAQEAAGRLDKYISDQCPQLSRSHVQKLIEEGQISVNGAAQKASYKIAAGDVVDISVPPPEPSPLIAEDIPLDILYEDQYLLVINKPAGLTVHPAPGHRSGTLVNAVLAHTPELETGETNRPGIVHRLDKDTSGIIVVAKNAEAHMKLAEQFKNRTIKKQYLALVIGHIKPEEGLIEGEIGRDPRNRQRMAIVESGREAHTEYKVKEYYDGYSLLDIHPRTGRTHQIRVHLAAVGFPIAGDRVYGGQVPGLERQFLHAYKLEFELPSSGELREFTAELPRDLSLFLKGIVEKTQK